MLPHILWRLESGTQSCRPLVESWSRKSARVCKLCMTEQTGNCTLHDRAITSSAGDAHCCAAGPCKHDQVMWSLTERNKEKMTKKQMIYCCVNFSWFIAVLLPIWAPCTKMQRLPPIFLGGGGGGVSVTVNGMGKENSFCFIGLWRRRVTTELMDFCTFFSRRVHLNKTHYFSGTFSFPSLLAYFFEKTGTIRELFTL